MLLLGRFQGGGGGDLRGYAIQLGGQEHRLAFSEPSPEKGGLGNSLLDFRKLVFFSFWLCSPLGQPGLDGNHTAGSAVLLLLLMTNLISRPYR